MPLWSEILRELSFTSRSDGSPDFDLVRRKYLRLVNAHANHQSEANVDTILYATAWIQKPNSSGLSTLINDEDLHALMETTAGLKGPNLDLILHSPGGSGVAAEAIVMYLRSRFPKVRVLVPKLAMSAASMIACAADEIVMGKHSFLGPTDPQIPVRTPAGLRYVAAIDVLEQAKRVRSSPYDPVENASWQAMLTQYGADIVRRCEQSVALAQELTETWLNHYLLKGNQKLAAQIARWLSANESWRQHGRHITRWTLQNQGLPITPLEDDDVLQDLLLSVFHATTHTFFRSRTVKIVENHLGRSYMKFEDRTPAPASL